MKLIESINDFKSKDIEFVALENNLDITTPIGMLLFNIRAALSEMEREFIRERRVKAGFGSARQKGSSEGRPKTLTTEKAEVVKALRLTGKSQ